MPLRGAAYETLRNGVRPPNLCFLNARDQLYACSAARVVPARVGAAAVAEATRGAERPPRVSEGGGR